MSLRIIIVLASLPCVLFAEQFVVQKKRKQAQQQQKERLAECHADIAQYTNRMIQQAAHLQNESHTVLKNISEGKSVTSIAQELEFAEKKLESLKRCCNDLTKCCRN